MTKTTHINLDLETRSECDLKKEGVYRYTAHPSTRILLASWFEYDGLQTEEFHFSKLKDRLADPNIIIHAWNAAFERLILAHQFPELSEYLPPSRFRCTAIKARYWGLPGSLKDCSKLLLEHDKQKFSAAGTRLINYFSKPKKDGTFNKCEGPKWREYVKYNQQDVVAESEIDNLLPDIPEHVQREYEMDQEINDRGMPVNETLLHHGARSVKELKQETIKEMKMLTGVDNPNSPSQLKDWVNSRETVKINSLAKDYLEKYMANGFGTKLTREVLALRLEAGMSSLSKYEALQRTTIDGRVKGTIQFLGAGRTGRDSGRAFQPQNLARGTLNDNDLESAVGMLNNGIALSSAESLSSCVRACIGYMPESEKTLLIADYSSIEPRVAAWLTGCYELNRIFEEDLDIYKEFGAKVYHKPAEEITKEERTKMKTIFLGSIYGIGEQKLYDELRGYGVKTTEEEVARLIESFHAIFPEIRRSWWEVIKMMKWAVNYIGFKKEVKLGGQSMWVTSRLVKGKKMVSVILPSGRAINYYDAEIKEVISPRGDTYKAVHYDHYGTRTRTRGAKLFENIVQAISRDVFYQGLANLRETAYAVVGRVHDEIIAEGFDDLHDVHTLTQLMCRPPEWAPNLILKAEGFKSKYYRK